LLVLFAFIGLFHFFILANACASNQKSVHHANAIYYYKNSKNLVWRINKEKAAFGFQQNYNRMLGAPNF